MINNNFSLGMISFSNGIYQGLINNSQREGIGIYIWDNGQIYIGEWKNNNIEGMGQLYINPQEYIFSNFINGKANGVGIIRMKEKDVCVGEWKNGIFQFLYYFYNFKKNITFKFEKNNVIEEKYSGFIKSLPKKDHSNDEYEKLYQISALFLRYKMIFSLNSINTSLEILHLKQNDIYLGFCLNKIPNGLGIYKNSKGSVHFGNFENGILKGISFIYLNNNDFMMSNMIHGSSIGRLIYSNSQKNQFYYSDCNFYGVPQQSIKIKELFKEFKQEKKEIFEKYLDKFNFLIEFNHKTSKKIFNYPKIDNIFLNDNNDEGDVTIDLSQKNSKANINTSANASFSSNDVNNIYKYQDIYRKILRKEVDTSKISESFENSKKNSNKKHKQNNSYGKSQSEIISEKDNSYFDNINELEKQINLKKETSEEKKLYIKDNEESINKEKIESKNICLPQTIEKERELNSQSVFININSKDHNNKLSKNFKKISNNNQINENNQFDTLQHCYLNIGVSKNNFYNLLNQALV